MSWQSDKTALIKILLDICYTLAMGNPLTPTKLQEMKKLTVKEPEIIAGYLFGSYAQKKNHAASDVDMGFLCFEKKKIDVVSFSLKVAKLFLPKETDVLICDLNERPLILMEIINGQVIYEKNPLSRIFLETRILKLYEDYQHLKEISNYYLNQSFMRGVYAVR